MGQYWKPINFDKKEYINPHKLGSGLKLSEQLATSPGVGAALVILMAAQRGQRGGGDLDQEENWHGPERTFPKHNCSPGPMPQDYKDVAMRTIGRWAGDRVALLGDYSEPGDMPEEFNAGEAYHDETFIDITNDVCRVIEHELRGMFVGEGWRDFKRGAR